MNRPLRTKNAKGSEPEQHIHDDCYILAPPDSVSNSNPTSLTFKHAATFSHDKISLKISTTAPSFHFYTGFYNPIYKENRHGQFSGVAFEPERYVDSVNREEWKKCVTLGAGERYIQETEYEIKVGRD